MRPGSVLLRPRHGRFREESTPTCPFWLSSFCPDLNTTGLGEMGTTKTGTWGWTPLENVHGEVETVLNQDALSVELDVSFVVAIPLTKNEEAIMWSHTVRGVFLAGGASVGL